jgi:hypothetical protein
LSADFQIRLISPIILLVMYKYPKAAIQWALTWTALGFIAPVIIRVVTDMPYPLETFKKEYLWQMSDSFLFYYNRTDVRFFPYMAGVLCSYFINRKPNTYLGGRVVEALIWFLTWFATFASMIWGNQIWQWDYSVGYVESLIFMSFSKLMHISGWFWLTYACATGRGGL